MKRSEMTPQQRAARNKQNAPARNRYDAAAYEKTMLRVRRDGKDGFTWSDVKAAAAPGSVNAFVLDAIREKLQRGL